MRRTEAREMLMKMLYQMEAQNDFSENAKQTYIENYMPESDQIPYIDEIYKAFTENKDAVDQIIEEHSNGWKINRISKVDLSILRLSVTEMKFANDPEIEEGTSIDEAVSMARKYSDEKSRRFVNGILGSVARS